MNPSKSFWSLYIACCILPLAFKDADLMEPGTFPYLKSGLTKQQAAAHLLSRFTFGAKPGDIDRVVSMGLENWWQEQLNGKLKDDFLDQKLEDYKTLRLSNKEIINQYPPNAIIKKMAEEDGLVAKTDSLNKKDFRKALVEYRNQKGFKPERELYRELANQKILRAMYSNNQLDEVLTDFWFNHFNVSLTKRQSTSFILPYERDAIRPHVIGHFEDLLLATAHAPAMLTYLDNFTSSAADENKFMKVNNENKKRKSGLNENYARELMELHTLGVDGGYTQQDVTEAARILTGWTIFPMAEYGEGKRINKIIDKIGRDRMEANGSVFQGDFLFVMSRHDQGSKTVMGKIYPSAGYQEGLDLLHNLAIHPSTAKFISKKLAIRFVSDTPAVALIDKMSKTFIRSNGDIKAVLNTMIYSDEFWQSAKENTKTKSPLEFAISSIRALDADVKAPYALYAWISKMGEKLYSYIAPTGFPDQASYWVNTGALISRMNFAMALSTKRIPGIDFKIPFNTSGKNEIQILNKELEYILPYKDHTSTVSKLSPIIIDPSFVNYIKSTNQTTDTYEEESNLNTEDAPDQDIGPQKKLKQFNEKIMLKKEAGDESKSAEILGILLGSPDFQKR